MDEGSDPWRKRLAKDELKRHQQEASEWPCLQGKRGLHPGTCYFATQKVHVVVARPHQCEAGDILGAYADKAGAV